MDYGGPPELLDCGDVAMDGQPRKTVRMAATLSPLQRIDSAFRFLGAYRVEKVSLNRVSPEQGVSELCTGLSRDLDRDALPDGFSSQTRIEGTGNG